MADSNSIADVLIIGAGTIGCSIARELSKTLLKVVVVEKSFDVSQGASKSNSGIVHGGYDDKHGSLKAKLSHKGNRMFLELNEELNFGFSRIGSLTLAHNDEELNILKKLLENGNLNGVSGLKILSKEQVKLLEPRINQSVIAALHCHWTGITSPYEFVIALAENAVENGVKFRLNEEVVDILRVSDETSVRSNSINGHHYLVRTGRGDTFRARVVVNAAGLFADKIAAMVGANNFSIVPRKGEYIILEKSQGLLAKHVLFPVPTSKGKGILVSPTFHGNLLLGPTSRDTRESLSQREILTMIISSAKNTLSSIDPSRAITSYTGLRSKSDRGDFIIEESDKADGFINVAGIDSPGLTSSPAVAELVMEIIQISLKRVYGVLVKKNTSFNATRQPIIIKKGPNFDGRIDHHDPSKNIICRCERVTETEIVDAIKRPLGAKDTDSIKRRTRAGMGPCQGTFCESRVAAIISRETKVAVELVGRHSAGSSILPHRRVNEEDRQLLNELAKL